MYLCPMRALGIVQFIAPWKFLFAWPCGVFTLCMQGLVFSQRLKGLPLQIPGTLSLNASTFVFCLAKSSSLGLSKQGFSFPSSQWDCRFCLNLPVCTAVWKAPLRINLKGICSSHLIYFLSHKLTILMDYFPMSENSVLHILCYFLFVYGRWINSMPFITVLEEPD